MIQPQSDGSFLVDERDEFHQRQRRTFGTLPAAQAWRAALFQKKAAVKIHTQKLDKPFPLPQAFEEFLAHRADRPVTLHGFRMQFAHFCRYFKKSSVEEIKPLDLDRFLVKRRKEVAYLTWALEARRIRLFFGWLTENCFLPANPAAHLHPPLRYDSPGRCLSWEEEMEILNLHFRNHEGTRARILLARDAACRAAESGRLRRGQIDFENNQLLKLISKLVPKERRLPMTTRLHDALWQFRDLEAQALLFPGRTGQEPNRSSRFLRNHKHHLVFHFRYHDLRHTFTTRFEEATGNLTLAGWCLGHTVKTVTGHYYHPSPEALAYAFTLFEQEIINHTVNRILEDTTPCPESSFDLPLSPVRSKARTVR